MLQTRGALVSFSNPEKSRRDFTLATSCPTPPMLVCLDALLGHPYGTKQGRGHWVPSLCGHAVDCISSQQAAVLETDAAPRTLVGARLYSGLPNHGRSLPHLALLGRSPYHVTCRPRPVAPRGVRSRLAMHRGHEPHCGERPW